MTMNAIAIAIGAGTLGIPSPGFFAPLPDAGSGAAGLTLGAGAGSSTFTRATSAATWGPNGFLLTVGPGVARSAYTELTGAAYLGILIEEARTNSVIQNRDFTNAAWAKTTMTAAKDQSGIDGGANTASSLLATGANATAAQTITIAAVNRPFSIYVAQLVGTGGFDISQDGVSFTHFALTGSYQRFTLVASQLNPVLTIRIPTNGDKIAVDYAMLEDSGGAARTFPLSPIATTTVAVTRNADVFSFPVAGNLAGTAGTAYAEITGPAGNVLYTLNTNPGLPLFVNNSPNQVHFFDGTNNNAGAAITPSATPQKVATKWGGATGVTYVAGVAAAPTAFDGDMSLGATLFIGSNGGVNNFQNGTIKNVKVWQMALTDGQIAAL